MPRRTLEDVYRKSITTRGRTENRTEVSRRALKRDQDTIMRFMSQRDIPSWYRGLSVFQMEAADMLLNALRDDTEQSTSHRVRNCLFRIGLIPMVNSKQTKTLMRLARGNDLAFLWFLNELHYKTEGPEYSVNEQLIYSAIAHLDMVTTMRELDRILPPPQPPKKRSQRHNRKKFLMAREKEYKKRWLEWKKSGMGPYFEPLRLPPEFSLPLTVPKPDLTVNFHPYHVWNNPAYAVPNEKNRWYSDYNLQPSKRIARNIINEEIQNIFDDFEAAALKSETVKTLCEHHKTIAELEKHLETELKVIARDRCLEDLEVNKLNNQVHELKLERTQKNRVLHIQQQLEKDVERYLAEFRKMAKTTRRQCLVKTLSHESRCAYLVRDNYDFDPLAVTTDCDPRVEKVRVADETGETISVTRVGSNRLVGQNVKNFLRKEGGRDFEFSMPRDASTTATQGTGEQSRCSFVRKSRSHVMEFSEHYLQNYDFGHSDAETTAESQMFFQAPRGSQPAKFDYRKIFTFKQNNAKTLNIKRAFVEAVDSDLQVLHQLQDVNMPLDLDTAIHNCAKKIWRKQLAKKISEDEALAEAERELERTLDEESAERLRLIRMGIYKNGWRDHSKPRRNVLGYIADYYDPDDLDLMNRMLKDALHHMSQDPKFVLASMPDSYKMSTLREWIRHRFGKRYSRDYLVKSLNFSWKIFHALDTVGMDIPRPSSRDMGRNLIVDYSCRDYILKKNNMLKKHYNEELNKAVMNQARVLWFAMRPQLCSRGPPRHTYFAYMPARIGSITTFRPWRPQETMRSKSGGEKQ